MNIRPRTAPAMMSLAVAMAAMLLLFAAMYVLFTEAALSGGTFNPGSIDLKVRDNDEAWADSVTATWMSASMKPGDELPFTVPYINLENAGAMTAGSLDISAVNSVTGPNAVGALDMGRYMEITRIEYSDSVPTMNLLNYITDVNGNGWKDLDDLQQAAITGLPAPVGIGGFSMGLRFRPEAGNAFQGESLTTNITFTLNQ